MTDVEVAQAYLDAVVARDYEQHPSNAAGRRAKGLAVGAFANCAMAGKRWAASGRARLAHRRIRPRTLAGSARTFAKRGNRLLVAAGKLLS
jgi:hypothetical protein